MLERFWITEDETKRNEYFTLCLRVKYNKSFESLPIINQIVTPGVKKNIDQCSDEEKEFHTNVYNLSREDLGKIRDEICGVLKEEMPDLRKLIIKKIKDSIDWRNEQFSWDKSYEPNKYPDFNVDDEALLKLYEELPRGPVG